MDIQLTGIVLKIKKVGRIDTIVFGRINEMFFINKNMESKIFITVYHFNLVQHLSLHINLIGSKMHGIDIV